MNVLFIVLKMKLYQKMSLNIFHTVVENQSDQCVTTV